MIPRIPDHGGGLARAMRHFGAGDDWIDLSTGINPWPYPVPDLPDSAWQRLPDEDALAALEGGGSGAFYRAGPEAPIAAAPGSQALIQLLPHMLPPGEVAVVGPSYAEHARCWRLAGHTVTETSGLEGNPAPVLVVVNPNNPDGRCWPSTALMAAIGERAGRGARRHRRSFCRNRPGSEPGRTACGRPGLVVLRSFGKFFGLAGLRLGFALGPADLIERIEDALGPWAVSGPALAIGRAALVDTGWADAPCGRGWPARAAELDAVLARAMAWRRRAAPISSAWCGPYTPTPCSSGSVRRRISWCAASRSARTGYASACRLMRPPWPGWSVRSAEAGASSGPT